MTNKNNNYLAGDGANSSIVIDEKKTDSYGNLVNCPDYKERITPEGKRIVGGCLVGGAVGNCSAELNGRAYLECYDEKLPEARTLGLNRRRTIEDTAEKP
jgi:hypothetical protein